MATAKANNPYLLIVMNGATADMKIFGALMGDEDPEYDAEGKAIPGVKFGAIKAALEDMKAQGVDNITCLLNSPGGDMQTGFSCYDAFKTCGMKANFRITGMAASMATIVMLAGDELPEATQNAMFMFHKPKGNAFGEVAQIKETADLLQKMEDRCVSIYAEAFGMDEADVKKWMKPGANKWFTAQEALDSGIIRGIVPPANGAPASAKLPKPGARMSAAEIWLKMSAQEPAPIIVNKFNMKIPKITLGYMKALPGFENTPEDMDEATALVAISDLVNANMALDKKVKDQEKAVKLEMRTRATGLADKAITDKKWLAADKEELIAMAVENYAGTEKMLSRIPAPKMITDQIELEDGDKINFKMTDEEKKFSFDQWSKKNPKKLAKMKAEAFPLFAQLHEAEYGVLPKKDKPAA